MKTKKTPPKKPATKGQKPRRLAPVPCSQFWVLDAESEATTAGTIEAHGPFCSHHHAECYIRNISAQDWITMCGCLRTGDPNEWGSTFIVVKTIRTVKPVPPTMVEMTLVDTANGLDQGTAK